MPGRLGSSAPSPCQCRQPRSRERCRLCGCSRREVSCPGGNGPGSPGFFSTHPGMSSPALPASDRPFKELIGSAGHRTLRHRRPGSGTLQRRPHRSRKHPDPAGTGPCDCSPRSSAPPVHGSASPDRHRRQSARVPASTRDGCEQGVETGVNAWDTRCTRGRHALSAPPGRCPKQTRLMAERRVPDLLFPGHFIHRKRSDTATDTACSCPLQKASGLVVVPHEANTWLRPPRRKNFRKPLPTEELDQKLGERHPPLPPNSPRNHCNGPI